MVVPDGHFVFKIKKCQQTQSRNQILAGDVYRQNCTATERVLIRKFVFHTCTDPWGVRVVAIASKS
jgi:hypothetical protein